MDCSLKDENAIALKGLYRNLKAQNNKFVPAKTQVCTPQRKARYSDKQRIRLKDAKSWALRQTGCKSTAEIKQYLKILGKKLDLRLTSAWVAINRELAGAIASLVLELNSGQAIQTYVKQWSATKVLAIAQSIAKLPFVVPTCLPISL